jgi:hypothetical protein
MQQEFDPMFVEKAARAGAINAHLLKKKWHWTHVKNSVKVNSVGTIRVHWRQLGVVTFT